MDKNTIHLKGHLTETDLKATLIGSPCQLGKDCFHKINQASALIEKVLQSKKAVYGVNTGLGLLANQRISDEHLEALQKNILLSHAAGTGPLLSDDLVRLILILKINSLIRGFSGVRLTLINHLIAFYNKRLYPCIPTQGSVGASGDLVPLAHLSLPLIGEGEVRLQGKTMTALMALRESGLDPISLQPKEGLALINGLQVSEAIALKALFIFEHLFHLALLVGSLSVDVASGSDLPFDEKIQQLRGLEAQTEVAKRFRELLKGSEIREQHRDCDKVQDPYSLRCQPQIMGAILHQFNFVKQTLLNEANAVTDNPLVFAENETILSGGNFHGELIAMASDNLSLAIAELGAASERRIALLIDPHFSGLPAFLTKNPGLNSGFMVIHVTAASAASANKALAHPHCIDSIPTSANQEDHVSMSTNAALRLEPMLMNTATILAIEVLAACQALSLKRPLKTSPKLEAFYQNVRSFVKFYDEDRYFAPDLALIKDKILTGAFDDY